MYDGQQRKLHVTLNKALEAITKVDSQTLIDNQHNKG